MCGVDSSTNVINELYQCVIRNFGYPKFWGRYLTRVPNSSEGLTKEKYPWSNKKESKLYLYIMIFEMLSVQFKVERLQQMQLLTQRILGYQKKGVICRY